MIDPQAERAHAMMTAGPPLNQLGVGGARAWSDARTPPLEAPDDRLRTDEITLDDVPVRVYRPAATVRPPVVVFIHGGGWVLGTVDGCDWVCRRLALTAGVAVVSVDYRLSPEAVYPAALEDCVTVLRNVGRLSATFDLDGSAVCVAGESSGGQLAAATCIRARDLGIPVRAQLLVCPVIDPAMDTASWHELGRDHLPVREQMSWMWDLYSGSPEVREGDPLVNLAAQDDLSGLPETIILTSEYDPLRDEAEEYGRRLQKAGVPTDVRRQAGQVHTVFGLARAVTACGTALDETAQELGALLRR